MLLGRSLKRALTFECKSTLNFSTTSFRRNEELKRTITASVEEENTGLRSMDQLLNVVRKSTRSGTLLRLPNIHVHFLGTHSNPAYAKC